MEEYKRRFEESHKLNSLVACTLSNPKDQHIRNLIVNGSYINPETTNGLHMMSGTYLYTNPPPYGYGSPAPYVAATVNRAYEYNRKDNKTPLIVNGFEIEDVQIPDIKDFPKEGITGNYNPSLAWSFAKIFLIRNSKSIIDCAHEVIDFMKRSNSDVLSKGRQTWDPETFKSTTCSKAFNGFVDIMRRNLGKTPSTMMEALIMWYELYDHDFLIVKEKRLVVTKKKKFIPRLKIRLVVSSNRFEIKRNKISGKARCNKWLDDYARSFCSYIKHAERGKKDRRAIASGSMAMRAHLKVIEEFHLRLSKLVPGSTISIGGEEKKKKIINELQMSSLKEGFATCYSLQATEDATKWNECLNPLLFAMIHNCWFDDNVRISCSLPKVTDDEKAFEKICRMGFYYLSIKRIHLGIGFLLENDTFFTRIPWSQTKSNMLSEC